MIIIIVILILKKLFLYFLKRNFSWSVIDLQCVSFRCIAKGISSTYTCIHSFLDYFPK